MWKGRDCVSYVIIYEHAKGAAIYADLAHIRTYSTRNKPSIAYSLFSLRCADMRELCARFTILAKDSGQVRYFIKRVNF